MLFGKLVAQSILFDIMATSMTASYTLLIVVYLLVAASSVVSNPFMFIAEGVFLPVIPTVQ